MVPKATDPCPCGRLAAASGHTGRGGKKGHAASVLRYADCCGRYLDLDLDRSVPAPDAASLMRSRYTAFACEQAGYLQATWHASTRPAVLDFDPAARWLGLDLRSHHATGADQAVVEFVARYRVGGRAVRLHETSRFVCEGGRWFYVDGDLHA